MIAMAEAKSKKKEPEYPDTPSGKALQEVGNIDGESVDPENPKPFDAEAVNAHGEKYQAAKKKHRWG